MYVELAQELDNIFNDYEIKIEQITHIVTDGGSAFCKMFKEFGNAVDVVIQCDSENEEENDDESDSNTPVRAANNEEEASSIDVVQQFMQNDDGELFQSEILEFPLRQSIELDGYFGDSVPTDEPQFKLPPQRRCFSHLLNLVPKYFEKGLPQNAERAFITTYNKMNALWNTANRSSHAKTICKNLLGCVLKVPCETRWNSKFDAIKRLFEIMTRESNFVKNEINILIKTLKNKVM